MAGIPIPDFTGLAGAQGQINQDAANQQTQANRPNQYNPYGQLTWTRDANGNWTQNVGLSGAGQGILGAAEGGLTNLAGGLAGGVNTGGLANWGDAGSLTNGVGAMPDGGFGASQQVIDAMKGLQQPGLTQARDAERARLAAMGITLGSDASNNSERQLAANQNDADMRAILAGTQEAGNVFNRQLQARQQGVAENAKSFDMAQALRGAQSNERLAYNTANLGNMQGLQSLRSSLNPQFQSFTGATSLAPPNLYQAGLDTYNAQLAQQNADRANRSNEQQGYANLVGQGLNAVGGLGGLVNGARAVWDWGSDLFGGNDGGYTGDTSSDLFSSDYWYN